jgi:8-oxo-dGTP pyrophosphatase MutT (NUDIX family)
MDMERIRRALSGRAPALVDDPTRPRAAVALVLRSGSAGPGDPEILFIERARHPEDPWSGHMAFPGGRVDPGDPGPRAAAERETFEEVGISLASAEPLGRLDDLEGRHAGRRLPLVISAYVYHAAVEAELAPNREVEDAFWVPLGRLLDPRHHVEYAMLGSGYPGIRVGDPEGHVVWGLTYRFLEIFLARLGHPLPDRWSRVPEARE